MNVLDLFSGIGGFSLGLERAGMKTVAFCEIEPFPRRVLAKHWPEAPIYDDVQTLTANRLRADGISVDLICGGFPCQDISLAGKGAGLAGERSGLWREYARLIGEIRPRYVVVENVAALLGRGLGDVLGDLATLGYDAEWHCIPASAVGAPHRRDRVWIIAHQQSGNMVVNANRCHVSAVGGVPEGPPSDTSGVCEDVANSSFMFSHGCDVHRGSNQEGTGKSQNLRELGNSGDNVPNTNGTRLQTPRAQSHGTDRLFSRGMLAADSWWSVEPNVGGTVDGFPTWLVRCVGKRLSYAESQRATKILRNVWSDHVSETLWRAARGLERIHQAQVLFSFVREYEAGTHEARLLVAGKEGSEGFLRSLRDGAEIESAPHQSEPDGQRRGEYPDALQSMPRLLARDRETPWSCNSWEDAIPRVAVGVPRRVDRLRGLGNAVVPQIPELIGRAIMDAEGLS